MTKILEEIAKGLESRFTSLLSPCTKLRIRSHDFTKITMLVVVTAVESMPHSAPGADEVTAKMLKN